MSETIETSRIPSEESCKTEQDLISELPDCILSHILSFVDTKDAVKTSILSKYWVYKWTRIPKYELYDGHLSLEKPRMRPTFASFVERTLLLSSNLQSFYLRCKGEYDMLRWIIAALSRDVRSLRIEGWTSNLVLSRELLTCYSLRELKLDHYSCTFKVHEKVCFPNLTTLALSIRISNEQSNSDRVEFNFPLLEKLELSHCKWLNTKFIEIYAPKMTDLELTCPVDASDECSLKITGDNIEHLNWDEVSALNHVVLSHVLLSGSAHVTHAYLELYFGRDKENNEIFGRDGLFLERCGLQLRKLLKGFSSLKDLVIGGDGTDAIAKSKLGLCLPMYYKMERLVLGYLMYSEALLELLHATPYLKTLGILL